MSRRVEGVRGDQNKDVRDRVARPRRMASHRRRFACPNNFFALALGVVIGYHKKPFANR
ncbi:hypothetical protein [Nonomuraea sp. NPDC049784]|uniref:hypothetical protein n=1 Tax=Nonomuraea sp. NPDC049784 TaxID=3154361 RepID=UPI0033FA4091